MKITLEKFCVTFTANENNLVKFNLAEIFQIFNNELIGKLNFTVLIMMDMIDYWIQFMQWIEC